MDLGTVIDTVRPFLEGAFCNADIQLSGNF
jgi:hypothetical protein